LRGEDILLGVGINPGGAIFALPHAIQIQKDGLDVIFILEKECVFDGLSDLIHLFQTHLLLLLVEPIFVEILNQFSPQAYVLGYFLIVFLSLICEANLIWHANAFEVFDKFAEVDVPCHKIAFAI
jgi:hypothetical protein